ncbi:GNAT family N-acetyltransferase [Micromonospora sp. HUAS LYJ1]|uniref:GNAT family N-acetyltransferase n=1 Tax=Micromonospora sp. HUAS LYJ1 TaxID=3061626 RepID=UPI0026720C06|nr:GNAT family N-acetyltransferase [Micromonospora sp. HUAS LYJ1]WKU05626.1 GNAT family N-acetyltransferase [Micromonospora sp. HUAS LYJ1]
MVLYAISTATSAVRFFTALVDLYATVYAEPPYQEGPQEVARFRESLPDEATRPGFSMIAAEDDGLLVGAAYGWTMPAGTWWSRSDQDPPPEIRDVDKFAVLEWMVHPDRRKSGIGTELMHRLLSQRTERYATLAANPTSNARRIYQRTGWRQVATSTLPWGPPMDLLIRPLPIPGAV